MAKMVLVFATVFAVVFLIGIIFRKLANQEKIALMKVLGYSIIVAAVTSLLLAAIVVLF